MKLQRDFKPDHICQVSGHHDATEWKVYLNKNFRTLGSDDHSKKVVEDVAVGFEVDELTHDVAQVDHVGQNLRLVLDNLLQERQERGWLGLLGHVGGNEVFETFENRFPEKLYDKLKNVLYM